MKPFFKPNVELLVMFSDVIEVQQVKPSPIYVALAKEFQVILRSLENVFEGYRGFVQFYACGESFVIINSSSSLPLIGLQRMEEVWKNLVSSIKELQTHVPWADVIRQYMSVVRHKTPLIKVYYPHDEEPGVNDLGLNGVAVHMAVKISPMWERTLTVILEEVLPERLKTFAEIFPDLKKHLLMLQEHRILNLFGINELDAECLESAPVRRPPHKRPL